MRDKITKRTVEAAQPGECDVFLWDRELPGFGCKITPKGRKVLASAEPGVRRCQRRILAPLAEGDRQIFMKMLEQLVELNNDYSRAPMRAPRGAGSRPAARRRRKSPDSGDVEA